MHARGHTWYYSSVLCKQLSKACEELNKRIFEHDEYGTQKGDITLPVHVPIYSRASEP